MYPKLSYTIIFSFFCYALFAQDISGIWEGYLDQSEAAAKIAGYQNYWTEGLWKKGEKTHNLKLTFEYNNKKKGYQGEYYINNKMRPEHYAKFLIKASVNNNKVTYNTLEKLFETKNSMNTSYCYSTANLQYSEDEKYAYLSGNWKGWNRNSRPCADAVIWVRKRKKTLSSPIYTIKNNAEDSSVVISDLIEVKDSLIAESIVEIPEKVNKETTDSTTVEHSSTFEDRKISIKDQLHTDLDSITLRVGDFNQVDGDIISLFLNDELILSEHSLTNEYVTLRVKLKQKKNILKVMAHNLGEIPPNTAEIQIERDGGFKKVILNSDAFSSEAIEIFKQ